MASRLGVRLARRESRRAQPQKSPRRQHSPRPADRPIGKASSMTRPSTSSANSSAAPPPRGPSCSRAFKHGKSVITANKALLSAHGEELFAAAQRCGTNLYYEASVAGGIPIIKVLREGLIGNRITGIYGIVNGTCNYILSRMKLEGADFADVLADAQRLGYAEAEPSLDVDGHDAAHKIGILASLAHGFWVNPRHIYVEGIRDITQDGHPIRRPARLHHQTARHRQNTGQTAAQTRQAPRRCRSPFIPRSCRNTHLLASVNGVFNAILVARRCRGRHALLRARRGPGRHGQRGVERSRGRRAGLEMRRQKPRLPLRAARARRRGRCPSAKSSAAITSG